jgi:hypothetical protein
MTTETATLLIVLASLAALLIGYELERWERVRRKDDEE